MEFKVGDIVRILDVSKPHLYFGYVGGAGMGRQLGSVGRIISMENRKNSNYIMARVRVSDSMGGFYMGHGDAGTRRCTANNV